MDAHATSKVFHLLLWLLYQVVVRSTDGLQLNPINGPTFSPSTAAKFECVINPYGAIQKWIVNTVTVAECGFSLCVVKDYNQGSYSFTNDTSSGMFTFTINPITLAYDGTVVGCYDGIKTEEYSITVTGKEDNGGDGEETCPLSCILSIICVIVVIVVIVVTVVYVRSEFSDYKRSFVSEVTDTDIYLTLGKGSSSCCVYPSKDIFVCKSLFDIKQNEARTTYSKTEYPKGTKCNFGGLIPEEKYEITLSSEIVCCLCCRKKTDITTILTTLPGQPGTPNIQNKSIKEMATQIYLKWDKPECAGDPTLIYKITYKNMSRYVGLETRMTDQTECTIENLFPNGTKYEITVCAINKGRESSPVTTYLHTEYAKPEKPEINGVTEINNMIHLNWKKPNCIGNPTLTYKITYKIMNSNDQPKEIQTRKTYCMIQDSHPDKAYEIKVYAKNNSKESSPATRVFEGDKEDNTRLSNIYGRSGLSKIDRRSDLSTIDRRTDSEEEDL